MFFRKPVKSVTVSIDGKVLRGLHSNKSAIVIPSPGIGKAIQIVSASVQTVTGNTPLAFTDTLGLFTGGIPTSRAQFIVEAPVINSRFGQWVSMTPTMGTLVHDKPIVFGPIVGANVTENADTNVVLDVMYRVVKA